MSDLLINLDEEINKLRSRCGELDKLYGDPPGPTQEDIINQMDKIVFWIGEINQKVTALERIKANKAAAQITVRGLTSEEIDRAQKAMSALNKVIQKAQTFNQILTTVTAILNGANTVIGAANRA
jgi:CHASE3 domain sensor protein